MCQESSSQCARPKRLYLLRTKEENLLLKKKVGLQFLPPCSPAEFFIYLICHDFRKINGRTKIFEKYTSGAVAHGSCLPPPYPRVLSPCRRGTRRQEPSSCARAGHRGARTLPPSGTAAGPYRRATRRQFFLVFDF
jgi:hypothetical protein